MLPLVEVSQIVQHYAPWVEAVFSTEALVQFQRYLSGLIISENKRALACFISAELAQGEALHELMARSWQWSATDTGLARNQASSSSSATRP